MPSAPSIDLLLLSLPDADGPITFGNVLHERLGYADCESWRAFAFWPRIHELERHYTRRSGDLLGAVIAHEIGHVLLPQRPHAARGIMRATIDPTVLTFQGFEPGEVSRIRQVLAAGR